jgi:hypothetical protein
VGVLRPLAGLTLLAVEAGRVNAGLRREIVLDRLATLDGERSKVSSLEGSIEDVNVDDRDAVPVAVPSADGRSRVSKS